MSSNPFQNLGIDPSKGLPADTVTMPGLAPTNRKSADAMASAKVRYQKLDLNEPGDIAELERIETLALHDKGIYVLGKERYLFMDKIFVLLNYIELDSSVTSSGRAMLDSYQSSSPIVIPPEKKA